MLHWALLLQRTDISPAVMLTRGRAAGQILPYPVLAWKRKARTVRLDVSAGSWDQVLSWGRKSRRVCFAVRPTTTAASLLLCGYYFLSLNPPRFAFEGFLSLNFSYREPPERKPHIYSRSFPSRRNGYARREALAYARPCAQSFQKTRSGALAPNPPHRPASIHLTATHPPSRSHHLWQQNATRARRRRLHSLLRKRHLPAYWDSSDDGAPLMETPSKMPRKEPRSRHFHVKMATVVGITPPDSLRKTQKAASYPGLRRAVREPLNPHIPASPRSCRFSRRENMLHFKAATDC